MAHILLVVFISVATVQFIYWLLFLIALLRYKEPESANKIISNPISIIVCAYNELVNLKRLIPILLNQNHEDFEIIIVNDRSDDGTYDYLNEEKDKLNILKVVNVDKVHDHISAKKYALTLGVKAAKNDILLFTDADCKPASEHWASKISLTVDDTTDFVIGYSPYEKRAGFLNAFIRFETQLTGVFYTAFALLGNPYMGVGRNLLYKKSMFMKQNGFNKFQNVVGGDDDIFVNQFANKKNTKISLGKDSLIWSLPKASWSSYFTQKRRHLSVGKLYKSKDKLLLGINSLTQVSFWLLFLPLILLNIFPEVVIGILIIRLVMITATLGIASKKFGEPINLWTIPTFDIIYSFYIIIAGVITLTTKKITWK